MNLSNGFGHPAAVALRPSRGAVGALLLAFGGTALVLAAWLPVVLALPALFIVILSAWQEIARHALRCVPEAVVGLQLDRENRCARIRLRGQSHWRLVEIQEIALYAVVVIITAREPGTGSRTVLIPRDAVSGTAFRRLRVQLGHWQRQG